MFVLEIDLIDNLFPFMTCILVHNYHLDESIPSSRSSCGVPPVFIVFYIEFLKQTVLTLIRRSVLWPLNWVCTVCIILEKGYLV